MIRKPLSEMTIEELDVAITVIATPEEQLRMSGNLDDEGGLWIGGRGQRFFVPDATLKEFSAEDIAFLSTYRPPALRRRRELEADEATPEDVEVDIEAMAATHSGRVAGSPNIINRCLDELIAYGAPISNRALGERLDLTASQVSGACSRLCAYALVDRVKPGVYKARDEAAERRHEVNIDVAVRQPTVLEEKREEPLIRVPAPMTAVSVDHVERLRDSRDAMVMAIELLDLICPDGVPAQEVGAAHDWLDDTAALIQRSRKTTNKEQRDGN